MPAGRPPKLTEVKVMEGTFRKDRVQLDEAEPTRLANIPEPPEWLTPAASFEWNVVATWLHEIGQLATTDLFLLAQYCNEQSEYWEFDRIVKKRGRLIVFEDEDGNPVRMILNPAVAGRSGALANALKLASQFGLTPVMRSRITQNKAQKVKSPLQLLIERKI